MTAREYAAAGLAVLRRDFQIAFSYKLAFVSQFLGLFFSLTLFYYVSRLVRVAVFDSADSYFAFVVVGLVILQILNSTLQTPPGALRTEMVAGTLERLVISPLGPVGSLVAAMLYPMVNALVSGLVMLATASLVFDLPVRWSTAGLAIPMGVLGALAFAPFGLALMAVVLVVKQAASGVTWVVAGISLLAGLYFPVELLPDWISWASEIQPFTASVDLMRNALVGTARHDPLWLDLSRVVGFAVVLLPLSLLALRRALLVSRRQGTIIEY
ncbi:MAG: ABC transporter permease [Acidimicrobiales bacterium]